MSSTFTEFVVEQAARAWLESTGWLARNGTDIAPAEFGAQRNLKEAQ